MSEFWDRIRNLFSSAEASSPTEPLIHSVIERSVAELADYNLWKGQVVCKQLNSWVAQQYQQFQLTPEDIGQAIDFLNLPSSKGFVIHFHRLEYSKRDAIHYFDFLKERTLEEDYRVQVSDLRTYNRPAWVETVQRHFLKPRLRYEEGKKSVQQYGNINIELLFRNEEAYQLKYSATSYSDFQFEKALEFGALMHKITI